MIRRKHSRSLQRGTVVVEEDVNPMANLVNVTDCMLVLAVGLLVALVTAYGLDLEEPVTEDEVIGIEVDLDSDDDGEVDEFYEEAGTVYQAPNGDYYLVTE